MNESSLLQSFLDRLDNIRIVLERPVVQYQLIAFFLVALVAWGLAPLAEPRAGRLGALLGRPLRFLIWEEFKAREIEIPYPQRDLHLRSGVPWDLLTPRAPASSADHAGEVESP